MLSNLDTKKLRQSWKRKANQSVSNLMLSQESTNDRKSTLEYAPEQSEADLSKVESNCGTLAGEKEKIKTELDSLKKQLETNDQQNSRIFGRKG